MATVNLTFEAIEAETKAALEAHDAQPWIAAEVARAVATAEAKDNRICGLYYLESYCQQLRTGRVDGGAEPVVSTPKPAAVMVDAKYGFAQAAFSRGLPAAIEAARQNGTCSLAIAHAHTCTSLGYFTEQIAMAGLLGIGFTNASAVVSPPGGNRAVLGTNPIAMAVPDNTGGIAFQFDQSTSAIALGKITMAKAAGESIPEGWAVDADGKPTTDPTRALEGSLVSSGGYKGWGFGLMAEVLAAAMTGSVTSTNVSAIKAPEGKPHDLGQFYLLLDPGTFAANAFWQRLDTIKDAVASQPDARLPGSRFKMPAQISVASEVWELTRRLANGT